MKYSREVKTALLAIIAIVILIFGYSFLKGENLLDNSRTFYAVYDDVEGLSPSSEVTINGLKVGTITGIDFLNESGDLLVTFTVKNDFPFSKSSEALIYGGSIIGGKSLAIVPKYDSKMGVAKSGDTLQGDKEEGIMELVNDRLTPLQKKLENTIVSADSMLTAITEILDDSTRNNIRGTFRNLDATVSSFQITANELQGIVQGNSEKLDRTFTNLDEMSGNFNKFSDTLTNMNISKITNDLEKVIADFEGISNKLNSKEGTAGKLLNDDAVYNNLDRATRQLEELLQDVKLNPKRYVHFSVFGKNPGPYDAPKDSLK
ncbi:phospholipid/cholesterol/gamma-HCH transport system substrate-binding protein [Christiangramia gaetbulicola]|uniref:Phospholipid/cholesterol/gamma-HCH transport system substrate-binding protein n=1 Tax=Christiangramia gaetbulicola TaxID=703340 RepID=A0A2T6AGV3_9FLAO|nr:MlaD family protein [Christiangramia gaetbulicola]PTX43053.1 phospholipid/cholesterol/gamma-HCH transport system substrate-binding protein [Christiangramia gaetbulicola]